MGDKAVRALVDTGCSTTVVASRLVDTCEGASSLVAFDGREVECRGRSRVELKVAGVALSVRVIVADNILSGIDVVMGMDVIVRLGGVTVGEGAVAFGRASCAAVTEPGGGIK